MIRRQQKSPLARKELRLNFSKFSSYILFQTMKVNFILENIADSDEMLQHAESHLSLHSLQMYMFRAEELMRKDRGFDDECRQWKYRK